MLLVTWYRPIVFSFVYLKMLSISPMPTYRHKLDEPPALKKGNVMPITGNMTRHIPMLIITCEANIAAIP